MQAARRSSAASNASIRLALKRCPSMLGSFVLMILLPVQASWRLEFDQSRRRWPSLSENVNAQECRGQPARCRTAQGWRDRVCVQSAKGDPKPIRLPARIPLTRNSPQVGHEAIGFCWQHTEFGHAGMPDDGAVREHIRRVIVRVSLGDHGKARRFRIGAGTCSADCMTPGAQSLRHVASDTGAFAVIRPLRIGGHGMTEGVEAEDCKRASGQNSQSRFHKLAHRHQFAQMRLHELIRITPAKPLAMSAPLIRLRVAEGRRSFSKPQSHRRLRPARSFARSIRRWRHHRCCSRGDHGGSGCAEGALLPRSMATRL
jgi:hypothetical protein